MKIAVPLADGKLTPHFGHCQVFALVEVRGDQIIRTETHVPPPHEPGVLPAWLHEMQTDVIIAGGMGSRAIHLFDQRGITVIVGAPELEPESLVRSYLDNDLVSGDNACDH